PSPSGRRMSASRSSVSRPKCSTPVGAGLARQEPLAGARARDVDRHEPVLTYAADEAVAEDADLVPGDPEAERRHVPLGGLPRIWRLEMDVVDAIGHGILRSISLWACVPRPGRGPRGRGAWAPARARARPRACARAPPA